MADALERDPHTIGEWLADFRQAGPAGLSFEHTGGSPPALSVQQQAELWARRTLAAPGDERERITFMYQSAFARAPTEDDLAACRDFLHGQARLSAGTTSPERQRGGKKPPALALGAGQGVEAWADLAHVLFNAKEFIFLH